MSKLSVQKLNDYKKSKNLTNKRIAELTNISIATIDRLFSGANTNPNINLLKSLAIIFDCTIDDFMEYDSNSPLANYYEDKQTAKLAQELHDNPNYRMLFDATKDLSPDDLRAVIDIANRIKGTNNG